VKIDIEHLRVMIFTKTGRRISADDPVFDIIILNEYLLELMLANLQAAFMNNMSLVQNQIDELNSASKLLCNEKRLSITSHSETLKLMQETAANHINEFQKEIVRGIEALLDEATRSAIEKIGKTPGRTE
jgi:hypothetical protein